MTIARHRHRGRPRSRSWIGRFGEWVSQYSVARLACDLGVDDVLIGRWARGDYQPSIQKAIAVVVVARAAGADLSLEDLYAKDFDRIRYRIRNQLPPL
jgi:hypothetical protein